VQRNQVGVADVGERAKLVLEPIELARVGTAHDLERHHLVANRVVSLVDDAHAPRAQAPRDREPPRQLGADVPGFTHRLPWYRGDTRRGHMR
jgi:hypothetical protein